MNKLIRVIISVPLAIVVATSFSGLFWWGSESLRRGTLVQRDVAYTWFLISLLITILPALLTGIVIPIFNLRPLWGAVTGAAAQILLPLLVVLAFMANANPIELNSLIGIVLWAFVFGTSGAIAGFLCGLLSPRKTVPLS